MRSGKPLFLAIALVVIVAGCTGSSGSRVAFDQNAGVENQSVSLLMWNELFDNDPITLTFEVQNVGGTNLWPIKADCGYTVLRLVEGAGGAGLWSITTADKTSAGIEH